jgi:hypothetical protein
MVLEEKKDKHGSYYRLGTIARLALTLENYASSEFGQRFYTDEFLKGVCERRNEIHANVIKASGAMVVASTVLAFFDSIEGGGVLFGFQFSVPQVGAFALCVYISMALFSTVGAFFDQLVIDRLLNTLGNRLGIYSFELLVLPYSARNLWISALSEKALGLRSGFGHRVAVAFSSALTLLLGSFVVVYPVATILYFLTRRPIGDLSHIEVILACISLFFLLAAFTVVLLFSISYKFRVSGVPEVLDPFMPENAIDLGARPPRRD